MAGGDIDVVSPLLEVPIQHEIFQVIDRTMEETGHLFHVEESTSLSFTDGINDSAVIGGVFLKK
jgi:hypothetical protein